MTVAEARKLLATLPDDMPLVFHHGATVDLIDVRRFYTVLAGKRPLPDGMHYYVPEGGDWAEIDFIGDIAIAVVA